MPLVFKIGYAIAFIGISMVLTLKTIKERRHLASLGDGVIGDAMRRTAHRVNLRWFPFLIIWNTFLFGTILGAAGYVVTWIVR